MTRHSIARQLRSAVWPSDGRGTPVILAASDIREAIAETLSQEHSLREARVIECGFLPPGRCSAMAEGMFRHYERLSPERQADLLLCAPILDRHFEPLLASPEAQ